MPKGVNLRTRAFWHSLLLVWRPLLPLLPPQHRRCALQARSAHTLPPGFGERLGLASASISFDQAKDSRVCLSQCKVQTVGSSSATLPTAVARGAMLQQPCCCRQHGNSQVLISMLNIIFRTCEAPRTPILTGLSVFCTGLCPRKLSTRWSCPATPLPCLCCAPRSFSNVV
jgi:hypothetical protein